MVLSDIAFRCSLVKENEEKKVGKDKRDTLYLPQYSEHLTNHSEILSDEIQTISNKDLKLRNQV